MPATINPIRRAKVKQELLKGRPIRQALKTAGYSERTAHGHCDKDFPVVRSCHEEIMAEFKLTDITPEYVIAEMTKVYHEADKNADKREALAYLGKYLALWTVRIQQHTTTENMPSDIKAGFNRIDQLLGK